MPMTVVTAFIVLLIIAKLKTDHACVQLTRQSWFPAIACVNIHKHKHISARTVH